MHQKHRRGSSTFEFITYSYNGDRWLNTTEGYEVEFASSYEPWVICDRMDTPWYDSRFRGYGKNKIAHLEVLNHSGYRCDDV